MNIKNQLKQIAKDYKIKVRFVKKLDCGGLAYSWLDKIVVCTTKKGKPVTDSSVINTFFHELGHITDYRQYRFRRYNSGMYTFGYAKKFALKAERSADTTGKRLCSKHFPELVWKESYVTKTDQKWLMKMIGNYFKE